MNTLQAVWLAGLSITTISSRQPTTLFSSLTDVSAEYSKGGSLQGRLYAYRLKDADSSRFDLQFVVYVAPTHAKLSVRPLERTGGISALLESVGTNKTLAVLNGGFFGFDAAGAHMPLGLVISAGKQLRPVHPWRTGGVVSSRQGGAEIIPVRQYVRTTPLTHALQSKPMLIEAGQIGIRSDDGALFDRSAVGLTEQGTLLFAGAFIATGQAVSLREFAALTSDWALVKQYRLRYVLAMDGGPSAHMYLAQIRRHLGHEHTQYVPNALVLEQP